MAEKILLVLSVLCAVCLGIGCAEQQPVSLSDFNYTVPEDPVVTTITEDGIGQTTYVGKVVDIMFREDALDVILFEDGTVVLAEGAENEAWRKDAMTRVRIGGVWNADMIKEVELLQSPAP